MSIITAHIHINPPRCTVHLRGKPRSYRCVEEALERCFLGRREGCVVSTNNRTLLSKAAERHPGVFKTILEREEAEL